MTRDPNILRDVMLFLETVPSDTKTFGSAIQAAILGVDPYDLGDHVEQLREIGFIDGVVHFYGRQCQPKIIVDRITSSGHDFIQTVRKDSVWQKVTTGVLETGKAWTIQMLFDYAKALAAEHLGFSSAPEQYCSMTMPEPHMIWNRPRNGRTRSSDAPCVPTSHTKKSKKHNKTRHSNPYQPPCFHALP